METSREMTVDKNIVETNLATLKRRLGFQDEMEFIRIPRYLSIETVNTCNASCSMCSIHDWTRKVEIMKDEMFDIILNRVAPIATELRKLKAYNDGEPLIDKKIAKRIERFKNVGVKTVNITTNGSLNTPQRNTELLNSGLDEIYFTVDGLSKDVYEGIRIGLDKEKVYNNILNFIELRNSLNKNTSIRLQMVVQPKNQHEYNDWKIFWSSKLNNVADKVVGSKLHNWGSQLKLDGANDKYSDTESCISLWGSMYILVDGTVAMCCCDYNGKHLFGDLKKDSIEDVWQNSPLLKKHRELHIAGKKNDISMCVGCTAWSEDKQQIPL